MKTFLKAILLAGMLVTSVAALSAQVTVAVQIGPPPRPRVVRLPPPRPAVEFLWVEGYWYPVGAKYKWHDGYWTRPPYEGARWVAPRYDGRAFFQGYWEGDRGRFEHDHRWDRDRDFRDHDRDDRGKDKDKDKDRDHDRR
jgi:hypothetical protein